MADNSERIAELKAKLKAREDKPGMAANVASLKAEIAKLEAEQD
jgi:hypothetical protein